MLTTWNTTRIHSDSMKAEVLFPSGIYGGRGAATRAIQAGDRLWVGRTRSDPVGIFDLER